ncbi:DNA-binding protein VF530 [Azoarcus communis]|uniref:VF530 family protein n=1 Tax=Parazoarcus communis TaxID=41977 RepID=UPI001459E631|nr:VF530 family protein [Parazoarcus communis]NMG49157.1 DNA-binding protein VF530 [Parazoarcus communis]
MSTQANNPLHGITLERLLTALVEHYGWAELGRRVSIRCFTHDPSIASSLKFLRRTPWAREQVEALYMEMVETGGTTTTYRR